MAQPMLDHGLDRDVARRDGRLGAGELGTADRHARHRSDELWRDDDHKRQDDRTAVAAP
jgi:hypothetical protein